MASSRALTSRFSLVKLLSPLHASPVLVRSFRNSAIPETNSDSDSDSNSDSDSVKIALESDSESKQLPRDKVCPLVNQFLEEGPASPYKVSKKKEAMYARLDMPGIGKEGLKLWVEDNSLYVKAEEEVDHKKDDPLMEEEEEGPRKYSGEINLSQGRYNAEEIEAVLQNGVLRIKVPKLQNKKKFINIQVK